MAVGVVIREPVSVLIPSIFQAFSGEMHRNSKRTALFASKIRGLTVIEAMAARVRREALTGPLRGLEKGIAVAQLYSLDDPPAKREATVDLSILTDEELGWYGKLAAKLTGVDLEPDPLIDSDPGGTDEAFDDGGQA